MSRHRNYYIAAWFLYAALYIQIGICTYTACKGYYVWARRAIIVKNAYRVCLGLLYDYHKHKMLSFTDKSWHISPEKQEQKKRQIRISRVETCSLRNEIIRNGTKKTSFGWPLKPGSFWLSSHFGPRISRTNRMTKFHYGIDLAARKGTAVVASRSGIVLYAGYVRGYGNMIIIKHGIRFKTKYAHLDAIYVRVGDHVEKGYHIGNVGDTGSIYKEGKDGSHLHFELYDYGKRVNPMQFLPK